MKRTAELSVPQPARPRRTVYLIKRLQDAVKAMLEKTLAPRGVTLTQYTILSLVSSVDGMSSADVARRFDVSKQATNQVINALERLALIERLEDPQNRRIGRIRLTRKGRTVLAACDRAVDKAEAAYFSRLPAPRLEQFRRAMEILLG